MILLYMDISHGASDFNYRLTIWTLMDVIRIMDIQTVLFRITVSAIWTIDLCTIIRCVVSN